MSSFKQIAKSIFFVRRRTITSSQLIIVSGVSCSGKSFFMDNIKSYSIEYKQPYKFSSKYSIEKYGFFNFPIRQSGSTWLHLELNPDERRQKKIKWIKFAHKYSDINILLIAPPLKILLSNLEKRKSLRKLSNSTYCSKKNIYSDNWLLNQYIDFLNSTSSLFTINQISILSEGHTIHKFLKCEKAKTYLKSIYPESA